MLFYMEAFAKLTPTRMYRHKLVSYVTVAILLLTMGVPHHVHHQDPLVSVKSYIKMQEND